MQGVGYVDVECGDAVGWGEDDVVVDEYRGCFCIWCLG